MTTNRRGIPFAKFGGLRLDLPLDEIGGERAQYLRDVDWDGNTGRLRPRDGFQKLKAADATGPYKGLFPHSATRLLATKRVSPTSVKIVAVDAECEEKAEGAWPEAPATSCFARLGTPSDSFTYCRANLPAAKVVRFDGTEFTEPTCSVDEVAGKEMPRGKFMAAWPNGGDRLIVANTGPTGGPGGAASSNSHVWFSEAEGKAEGYESTAYLQLGAGDGEEITGLVVFGGQVFIFKETKFFVVYGLRISEEGRPIFDFREVSLGEGSRMRRPTVEALVESSDQLVCITGDGVYFCTSDGIWVTAGAEPTKISQALRPLEEISSFDGPMADFLNGESEVFRWPATGIASLGQRLIVRRYEFMFILDVPTGEWTCWKLPAVSMCVWTGLSGGGAEVLAEKVGATAESSSGGTAVAWTNPGNARAKDGTFATCGLVNGPPDPNSQKLTVKNFSPGVPAGAAVVGIQVTLWAKVSGTGSILPTSMVLLREGTESSNLAAKGTVPHTGMWVALTGYTFGGPEELWGLSWTVPQINAATSGVALAVYNASGGFTNVEVDAMLLTVYYRTAESASGVRPRLFCTQGKSIFVTKPDASEDAGVREAEWQSGIYDLGTQDEKELVGVRAFGTGTIDGLSYSDFDDVPSVSTAHFEFPASGNRSVLDENGLTDGGVMFSHRLSLAPGSRIQRLVRYLREARVPVTKGR